MWMTAANLLTLLRLLATAPAAFAVLEGAWPTAAALFAFAVATDLLDGPLARRRGTVSPLGGLLDHASDAVFVIAVLAALAHRGCVPPLLPGLVTAAFAQYTLDSRALAGQPLRTSTLGRMNGIGYYVLAGIAIAGLLLPPLAEAASWIVNPGAWALITTTLASMAERGLTLLRGRSLGG